MPVALSGAGPRWYFALGAGPDPRFAPMTNESQPPPDREPAARSEPPPPLLSEPPPGGAASGWIQRVGEAGAFGLAIALLVAAPTAMRASGEAGGSFLTAWLVGAAILTPPLAITVGLVRAAGRGFHALAPPGAARARGLGLGLWVGLSVPALVVLGAGLRAVTHHRALGGATFGLVGLGILIVTALVAYRLVQVGQRMIERGVSARLVASGGVAVALVPLIAFLVPLFFAVGDGATARVLSTLLDGAIAIVLIALVSSLDLGSGMRRTARLGGVPASALVVIAGLATIETSSQLAAAMRAGGGLAATLLGAVERWTDRDGDGYGAHFGGGDCDEGAPARNPHAADLEPDGIDQNCDGRDGPLASSERVVQEPDRGADAPALVGGQATEDGTRAASLQAREPALEADPPDIVLVTLDTVRADRTSAYGYGKPTTPALEALAARGTKLVRAYAPASDTQRALMPLVTGLRLSRTPRGQGRWPTLYPEAVTLAERLKKAGYATAAVSSFTWLRRDRGYDQGFEKFEEAFREDHPERGVTGPHAIAAARRILRDLAGESRPTFLWVHLFDAHAEYLEHEGIDLGSDRSGRYDGEIAFVDRQLGALVDAVNATPRGKDAVWIVHGSHGEALGEHDYVGHGRELFEPLVRVPLVIAGPGLAAGAIDARAVGIGDVAPTVLDLAGTPAAELDGHSLLPLVRWAAAKRSDGGDGAGSSPPARPAVYIRGPRRAALVDGELKLVRVIREEGKPRHLLFDVDADPGEQTDLSGERGADLKRLIEVLDEREAQAIQQQYRRKRRAPENEADGEPAAAGESEDDLEEASDVDDAPSEGDSAGDSEGASEATPEGSASASPDDGD